jgi:DNA-binding CsgD family transcriptional regulator
VAHHETRSYDQEVEPSRHELSTREAELLKMVVLGMTNAEIAKGLNVTVHGVKFHLASIYRKLGVGNRTEAAVYYLRHLDRTAAS